MMFSSAFVVIAASLGLAAASYAPPMRSRQLETLEFSDIPDQLETCTEYKWSWTATGEGPYTYTIHQSSGGIFNQSTSNEAHVAWNVTAQGGKSVSISVVDRVGNFGNSGNITVVNGTDTSCTHTQATNIARYKRDTVRC
ncbi:hypothetical protein CYLTODRAFT_119826 [Cylindrobasidium torrendii FP15055 ss-10]|uniref:Secreted protein n=1 Tax=Cylindrobasidium torrendii FP15055 ss-10 TaxID=1314674 RepID=A0A0D7B130_9AGAR|nr:hypothetical protein CYLTODRAFT_119826 [Cylindrobasidium torrendii FP15055 ss-10]